jgi:hypothetical protein
MNIDSQEMSSRIEDFFQNEVHGFKNRLIAIESEYLSKGAEVEQKCLTEFTEAFHNSRTECAEFEKTLNVASGPGREYRGEFKEISGQVTLNCIDSDESALDHLQKILIPRLRRRSN